MKNIIREFVIRDFGEIAKFESVTELDLEDIQTFLVDDRTSKIDEKSKYNVIFEWTKGKQSEMLQHFGDLFSQLRLKQMFVNFIYSYVRIEPYFKSRVAC